MPPRPTSSRISYRSEKWPSGGNTKLCCGTVSELSFVVYIGERTIGGDLVFAQRLRMQWQRMFAQGIIAIGHPVCNDESARSVNPFPLGSDLTTNDFFRI